MRCSYKVFLYSIIGLTCQFFFLSFIRSRVCTKHNLQHSDSIVKSRLCFSRWRHRRVKLCADCTSAKDNPDRAIAYNDIHCACVCVRHHTSRTFGWYEYAFHQTFSARDKESGHETRNINHQSSIWDVPTMSCFSFQRFYVVAIQKCIAMFMCKHVDWEFDIVCMELEYRTSVFFIRGYS